ncbi:MAG: peptide deformylase [Deltaproteobacteria bacterium]|nr:peptide deformylase [Deltaproteobacteria bacterium]
MAKLDIVTYPNLLLVNKSESVLNITEDTRKLIQNMADTMYSFAGVGLAAIQVGIPKKIIIYDLIAQDNKKIFQALINPEIVEHHGVQTSEKEGCLSLPDLRTDVKRFKSVSVKGLNEEGEPVTIDAEGLLAVILQHEIEHLNGILLVDKISALRRNIYKRKTLKNLKRK